MSSGDFPFSAVVGQDAAKLALLLAASEPLLGGVLLRGDKGSAKTTLARGLAALLPGAAPFVELPLGASEDRVLGSVELGSLLAGQAKVRLGLLASAHGGVLYVDEINLLADHLIDALLDVAVSGINRIERDGVSHSHPARFVLIGSMNPEEGELRPQLLDRFGFAVEVRAEQALSARAQVVARRLAFERGPGPKLAEFRTADAALAARLESLAAQAPDGRPVLPEAIVEQACRIALAVGAEGLRADLMLCRGARAHAAFHDRDQVTSEDLEAIAGFVLAHRRRRSPLEPPGISERALEEAFTKAREPESAEQEPEPEPPPTGQRTRERLDAPTAPLSPPAIRVTRARSETSGKRGQSEQSANGRFVRAEPFGNAAASGSSLAAVATLQAVAERRVHSPDAALDTRDLRVAVRAQKTGHLVILCVDGSGSMGVEARMALAKGAALGLLTDAYQRRDRVALVTFAGDRAETVLRPTASVEIAQARLSALPTGGNSPIAAGLDAAFQLAEDARESQRLSPLLVLITDGRATGESDAVESSLTSARRFAEARIPAVVIDVEAGPIRLHLARSLAEVMGAPCLPLEQLEQGSLEATIRLQLG